MCWNSISCLEGWERALRLTGVVGAVVTVIVVIITGGGSYASYKIGERLAVLKAPRTLAPSQQQAIVANLQGKPTAPFVIKSDPQSPESDEYGRQLEKILQQGAGWSIGISRLPFPIHAGEEPTTGITIMVDGRYAETVSNGRNLEAALRNAKVEGVKLEMKEISSNPQVASWVFIKVGRKGNQ